MMMRRDLQRLIVVFFTFSIFFSQAFTQAPAGYYLPAEGKTGTELKATLHTIIKGHKTFPYSSGSTDVWDILKLSDRDPANPANVILFYTGWSVNAAQEYNNNTGWNREHVWAKSHGPFDENTPGPGTDCHHLRPADISVNAARGNMYFGTGDVEYIDPSGATGCKYSTSRNVWEPRDFEKGDVARMIFYMATRYEGDDAFPDLEVVDYVPTNDASPLFGVLSTLIQWNQLDPVDDFEMNRNNVVYSFQKNRNPFIDHPEYVNLIWGPPVVVNIAPQISNITSSPNPVYSSDLITITAGASDSDGSVDSVKLFWGYGATSLSDSSKMSFSNGVYTGGIVGQSAGTVVYYKISAWDNSKAKSISDLQTISVLAVNVPPQIDSIFYSPALPSKTDYLKITAKASDSDGTVQGAKLYWGLNAYNLSNFSKMTLTAEGYSASILPQASGTVVYYKVEVTDNSTAKITSDVRSITVSAINNVSKPQENSGFVYPNPAATTVFVEHSADEYVIIYSAVGNKIIQTQNHSIDVSQMNKGLYLVQILDENGKVRKLSKLIVE
jgi:endonuclease I